MFDSILQHIRAKIRALEYVMTLHAEEEMNDDELSIYDVEHIILTGQIVERQQDQRRNEWKYLVRGQNVMGSDTIVVVKLSATDIVVIITVYVE